MRFKNLLTGLTLAVLLSGCSVRSLNPLYTERDVVFEPGLLGTWAEHDDADSTWTFQRDGENGYRFGCSEGKFRKFCSEGGKPLEGRLVKLSGLLFLDVTREQEDDGFAIPGHVFVKIELNGDTIRTAQLDTDWAEKAADFKTLGLSHIRIDSEPNTWRSRDFGCSVVLTAPTKELQDFVVRYARDKSVFGNEGVFSRLK